MSRPLEAAKPSITILAGIVLLGVILSLARIVLIPIALSILLAFTLSPAVLALQRRRVSRTPAVLLVIAATILAAGGAIAAVSLELHTLAIELPGYKENIIKKIKELQGDGPGVGEILTKFSQDVTIGIKTSQAKKEVPEFRIAEDPKNSIQSLRDTTGSLINIIGTVGLIIAMTMAMLLKREDLRNRLIRLAGHGELTSTTRAIDEATRRISRYLQVQLAVNAAFGAFYGLGLAIIGVDYALLWGFMAFLLRFVPFIGTWLAGVLPFIISFATSSTWSEPIAVITFTVLVGLAVNNVIEPMLVTRTTGVSPIGLVVAAAFWTWLWGPIGLVLSTPITLCLAVLGRFVPPLQFLDVLFGTDPALDPQEGYYQRLLARDETEAAQIIEAYLAEHSHTELCDFVLIPALVRAKEDVNLGQLSGEDLDYIVAATIELLQDLGYQNQAEATPAPEGVSFLILGCPAKDLGDELALNLFQKILAPLGRIKILGNKAVASEVVGAVRDEKPVAALISAVHPGGLAKVRYLVKRLRNEFPNLHIQVGYWGLPLTDTKLPQQLRSLGASEVATSLAESHRTLEAYLRLLPNLTTQEPAPLTEGKKLDSPSPGEGCPSRDRQGAVG